MLVSGRVFRSWLNKTPQLVFSVSRLALATASISHTTPVTKATPASAMTPTILERKWPSQQTNEKKRRTFEGVWTRT